MTGPRFDLKGTRVLVTGAAQGLGLGLAETFGGWGASVGIADYNGDQLEQARSRLDRGGVRHWAGKINVADETSVDEGVTQCWQALGGIDLLVNNAGVLSVAPVAELSLAEWTRILTVNATGVFLMSRAVVRLMLSEKRAGSVVSISSIGGKRGDPGIAHYAASKFAVIGFTQALAREVASNDILVNAVCPGVVETKMMTDFARTTRNDVADWVKDQVIPRSQTPADIAGAIAFLHQSRAVTGQAINVDGGTLFH